MVLLRLYMSFLRLHITYLGTLDLNPIRLNEPYTKSTKSVESSRHQHLPACEQFLLIDRILIILDVDINLIHIKSLTVHKYIQLDLYHFFGLFQFVT